MLVCAGNNVIQECGVRIMLNVAREGEVLIGCMCACLFVKKTFDTSWTDFIGSK